MNVWANKISRFRSIEKLANIPITGARGFNKKDGVAKVTKPLPTKSEPNPPIITKKQIKTFTSEKSRKAPGSLMNTGLGISPAKTLAKFPKIKRDRKGNIQKIANLLRRRNGISSH
jgi:hypothetical protein